MGPKALMQVLHHLPEVKDENLLVGTATADDAGVYKLTPDIAIVNTLDFFPPIVDDPYIFGSIAAANALSDIYAMGGAPKLAMNIVGFPSDLDLSVLEEIIKGSVDKLKEAEVMLIGGHSIEDKEIKYGLSVTGFVHPDKIVRNSGARAGDVLFLTKPIGVGVITTALKNRNVREEDVSDVIASMQSLNSIPSRIMMELGVHPVRSPHRESRENGNQLSAIDRETSKGVNACTDITGFGLIGHLTELADASDVSVIINSKKVPVFDIVHRLIKRRGNKPKSIDANREYFKERVVFLDNVSDWHKDIFYDPQTSGGLLISVSKDKSQQLLEGLKAQGAAGYKIGEVVKKNSDWLICVK